MYCSVKETTGLDTLDLQLVGTLVALNLILDPGQRLLLLQNLVTLTILTMSERIWRGGQVLLAIQETVVAGLVAGGEELDYELQRAGW